MVVITMKYLQRDQNNRFHYRRGIPKHVRVLFNGRSEFVKVLAKTEEEALQLYPKVHAHFEKQLTSALMLVPKKTRAKTTDPALLAQTIENMGFHTHEPATDLEERQRDSAIDQLLAQGLQVSTVKRYLKDIRAVHNYAAIEHDIPYLNPFQKIELPKQSLSQRKHQKPMPEAVVQDVLEYLNTTPSREPQLIFTLLYYTGARLAEITGLLTGCSHPLSQRPGACAPASQE
jgi:site-specific recombinase XerD